LGMAAAAAARGRGRAVLIPCEISWRGSTLDSVRLRVYIDGH
jgi:hypothetical protein